MRKQVKTPGDMVRFAMRNIKASRTLLLEARDSHHRESSEYLKCDVYSSDLFTLHYLLSKVAAQLDARRAELRAQRGDRQNSEIRTQATDNTRKQVINKSQRLS